MWKKSVNKNSFDNLSKINLAEDYSEDGSQCSLVDREKYVVLLSHERARKSITILTKKLNTEVLKDEK